MNCSNLSNNLLFFLMNREVSAKETSHSLRSLTDKFIQEHILKDIFFSYQLNFNSQSFMAYRNRQFIAFNKSDRIALYDLLVRKIIWSCNFTIPQGHKLEKVVVSRHGMVLAITNQKEMGSYKEKKCYVFSEGKQTGYFDVNTRFMSSNFEIVNSRLFSKPLDIYTKKICVRDDKGSMLEEIVMGKFSEGPRKSSTFNKNFYVLTTGTGGKVNVPARVFVFDLATGKKTIFDLEKSEHPIEIESAYIKKNTLFCGMNYEKRTKECVGRKAKNPKIVEMNLLTGEIKKTHTLSCKRGKVKDLLVNDDYIVYRTFEGTNLDSLWVIDRRDNTETNLLQVPYNFIIPTKIHLSFSGSLLNICCSIDSVHHTLSVLDLSKSTLIKKIIYKGQHSDDVSFQDGKLVILHKTSEAHHVYIEDFEYVKTVKGDDVVESHELLDSTSLTNKRI